MKLWVLVLINSLVVAIAMSVVNFYFVRNLSDLATTFVISLVICYAVFYYLIERYVYSKVKLIYKLIHSLKLGKDLKDALGDYVSNDPLSDVENEVKDWARVKKVEIDTLKSQEKFRREFLGNISHELKTPLFAVQGYLDAILDDELEDRDLAMQFLGKASRNVERLSELIKDLDVISKLESGEIQLERQKFDLVQLIKETIEQLELKAQERNIKLLFKDKYQGAAYVFADKVKISQVLINLIENSIKYGKENGITSIKIFELHKQILIEVTDDGDGIEEKHLIRIFERFYRIDKSRSRGVGGSGLGLSIVKHILEAHQQTITVRSAKGIGTTFAFTLEGYK